MNKSNNKLGFTLVELAIAMTIIAILLAGIAGGSVLLEQAKIRNVLSGTNKVQSAIIAFNQSYNAVPGDMYNASTFFAGCATGGIGNANCDGNGDGYITPSMGGDGSSDFNAAKSGDEPVKVFRHLHLSGILEFSDSAALVSNYISSGNVGSNEYFFPVPSTNDGKFYVATVDAGGTGGSPNSSGGIYENSSGELRSNFDELDTAIFIVNTPTSGSNVGGRGVFTPEQAYNMDVKIDDGNAVGANVTGAATGKFRSVRDLSGSNSCTTTILGNNYNVTSNASDCVTGLRIN